MKQLDLVKQNEGFAQQVTPDYLDALSQGQQPGCFVIACSDSRVSPSVITQAPLGSMFVHRNIANQVSEADESLTAGLYYALTKLKVRRLVVKGHTGCGGIAAAAGGEGAPEMAGWLCHIRDSLVGHDGLALDDLARVNVVEQVRKLEQHPVYRRYGQGVAIEGYLYHLETGRLELVTRTDGGGERHDRGGSSGRTEKADEAD